VRRQPAAQQPRGGVRRAELGRVARQQLRRLAEVLAHQPHQVLDHALLAAGRAIAVMEEQDHAEPEPSASRAPPGERELSQT
jgi:hypothetical protein